MKRIGWARTSPQSARHYRVCAGGGGGRVLDSTVLDSEMVESVHPFFQFAAVASEGMGQRQRERDAELIAAAWDNDVERARQLIAKGADVNAKDSTQQSAFLIATSEGYGELLALTFEHRADVRSLDSYNGTGPIRAAERGHAMVVGRLLREGIDPNHVNRLGWTALHEAIILGKGDDRHVDTVRLLVAGGADLTLRSTRDGVLPLAHAESHRQTAIAMTLGAALESNGSADANTDLLAAAGTGDPDAVAIALRQGADIEARDSRARTPLLLAVENDHVAAARPLVAFGADPNVGDAQHDTPWLVTGVTEASRWSKCCCPPSSPSRSAIASVASRSSRQASGAMSTTCDGSRRSA